MCILHLIIESIWPRTLILTPTWDCTYSPRCGNEKQNHGGEFFPPTNVCMFQNLRPFYIPWLHPSIYLTCCSFPPPPLSTTHHPHPHQSQLSFPGSVRIWVGIRIRWYWRWSADYGNVGDAGKKEGRKEGREVGRLLLNRCAPPRCHIPVKLEMEGW